MLEIIDTKNRPVNFAHLQLEKNETQDKREVEEVNRLFYSIDSEEEQAIATAVEDGVLNSDGTLVKELASLDINHIADPSITAYVARTLDRAVTPKNGIPFTQGQSLVYLREYAKQLGVIHLLGDEFRFIGKDPIASSKPAFIEALFKKAAVVNPHIMKLLKHKWFLANILTPSDDVDGRLLSKKLPWKSIKDLNAAFCAFVGLHIPEIQKLSVEQRTFLVQKVFKDKYWEEGKPVKSDLKKEGFILTGIADFDLVFANEIQNNLFEETNYQIAVKLSSIHLDEQGRVIPALLECYAVSEGVCLLQAFCQKGLNLLSLREGMKVNAPAFMTLLSDLSKNKFFRQADLISRATTDFFANKKVEKNFVGESIKQLVHIVNKKFGGKTPSMIMLGLLFEKQLQEHWPKIPHPLEGTQVFTFWSYWTKMAMHIPSNFPQHALTIPGIRMIWNVSPEFLETPYAFAGLLTLCMRPPQVNSQTQLISLGQEPGLKIHCKGPNHRVIVKLAIEKWLDLVLSKKYESLPIQVWDALLIEISDQFPQTVVPGASVVEQQPEIFQLSNNAVEYYAKQLLEKENGYFDFLAATLLCNAYLAGQTDCFDLLVLNALPLLLAGGEILQKMGTLIFEKVVGYPLDSNLLPVQENDSAFLLNYMRLLVTTGRKDLYHLVLDELICSPDIIRLPEFQPAVEEIARLTKKVLPQKAARLMTLVKESQEAPKIMFHLQEIRNTPKNSPKRLELVITLIKRHFVEKSGYFSKKLIEHLPTLVDEMLTTDADLFSEESSQYFCLILTYLLQQNDPLQLTEEQINTAIKIMKKCQTKEKQAAVFAFICKWPNMLQQPLIQVFLREMMSKPSHLVRKQFGLLFEKLNVPATFSAEEKKAFKTIWKHCNGLLYITPVKKVVFDKLHRIANTLLLSDPSHERIIDETTAARLLSHSHIDSEMRKQFLSSLAQAGYTPQQRFNILITCVKTSSEGSGDTNWLIEEMTTLKEASKAFQATDEQNEILFGLLTALFEGPHDSKMIQKAVALSKVMRLEQIKPDRRALLETQLKVCRDYLRNHNQEQLAELGNFTSFSKSSREFLISLYTDLANTALQGNQLTEAGKYAMLIIKKNRLPHFPSTAARVAAALETADKRDEEQDLLLKKLKGYRARFEKKEAVQVIESTPMSSLEQVDPTLQEIDDVLQGKKQLDASGWIELLKRASDLTDQTERVERLLTTCPVNLGNEAAFWAAYCAFKQKIHSYLSVHLQSFEVFEPFLLSDTIEKTTKVEFILLALPFIFEKNQVSLLIKLGQAFSRLDPKNKELAEWTSKIIQKGFHENSLEYISAGLSWDGDHTALAIRLGSVFFNSDLRRLPQKVGPHVEPVLEYLTFCLAQPALRLDKVQNLDLFFKWILTPGSETPAKRCAILLAFIHKIQECKLTENLKDKTKPLISSLRDQLVQMSTDTATSPLILKSLEEKQLDNWMDHKKFNLWLNCLNRQSQAFKGNERTFQEREKLFTQICDAVVQSPLQVPQYSNLAADVLFDMTVVNKKGEQTRKLVEALLRSMLVNNKSTKKKGPEITATNFCFSTYFNLLEKFTQELPGLAKKDKQAHMNAFYWACSLANSMLDKEVMCKYDFPDRMPAFLKCIESLFFTYLLDLDAQWQDKIRASLINLRIYVANSKILFKDKEVEKAVHILILSSGQQARMIEKPDVLEKALIRLQELMKTYQNRGWNEEFYQAVRAIAKTSFEAERMKKKSNLR